MILRYLGVIASKFALPGDGVSGLGQLFEVRPTLWLVVPVLAFLAFVLARSMHVYHAGVSMSVRALSLSATLFWKHWFLPKCTLMSLLEASVRLLSIAFVYVESHGLLGLVHDGLMARG